MSFTAAVYAIVGLAVAGAGAAVVWKYNSAIERAQTAETAAEGWQKAQQFWQKEAGDRQKDFDDADEIARNRGVALVAAKSKLTQLERKLAAVEERDVATRDWLDLRVPDAVRRVRRDEAGCSPDFDVVPCPAGAPRADTGTADARLDGSGTAAGERGGASGSTRLQSGQRADP